MEIYQVVIYLTPSESPLVYQTTFNLGGLSHQFNVIRLREQPTEIFQQYQGLLPFATLSQTNNPEETLRQLAQLNHNHCRSRIYQCQSTVDCPDIH